MHLSTLLLRASTAAARSVASRHGPASVSPLMTTASILGQQRQRPALGQCSIHSLARGTEVPLPPSPISPSPIRGMATCTSCGSDTLTGGCGGRGPTTTMPPPASAVASAAVAAAAAAASSCAQPAVRVQAHLAAAVARTRDAQTEQSQLLNSTFYRRPLPEHLVAFTSPEGKRLFKESLAEGFAENYFALAGTFTTQSEPAYCGLGSLAMVLNALEVDPKKRWKGGWRWYSDEMLECCAPLDVIKKKGITFREFSCMAKCNGLSVIAKQADQVSLDEFVADLRASCSNGFPTDTHMVVSFSRKALGQTGDGHFSPITAYHAGSNKALILDTARFKYPSYFADVELLYQSLQLVDKETGLPRGYFLLQRRDDPIGIPEDLATLARPTPAPVPASPLRVSSPPSAPVDAAAAVETTATLPPLAVPDSRLDLAPAVPLCQVRNTDARDTAWVRVARVFCSHVPRAVRAVPSLQSPLREGDARSRTAATEALIERILGALPPTFDIAFAEPGIDRTLPVAENEQIRIAHATRLRFLIDQVLRHPLYLVVAHILGRASSSSLSGPSAVSAALLTLTDATAAPSAAAASLRRSSPLVGSTGPARLRKWGAARSPVPASLTHVAGGADMGAVAATVLLLAVPREAYVRAVHPTVFTELEKLRGRGALAGPLKFEVERIHDQLQSLTNEYCECRNRSSVADGELPWMAGHACKVH
ncbi:hypothetical protein H9P43_007536 [Blastocladiella emersonii ATCC 22665]|nr:hypothetical protein H9P43_007536 [Blastocladiella emersonii ATCC 22665]